MKKYFSVLCMSIVICAFSFCENRSKGDEAVINDQQIAANGAGDIYIADTSDSKVRFTGYGVGKNHPGNFMLTTGTVAVNGNRITGGIFIIDIRSLDVEEKGDMFQKKLKPHLLSGDFFDAEKFGEAKFEITSVAPYEKRDKDTSIVKGANFLISGNLTLKDVTKNISFPAKINLDNDVLKGEADFDIDRTEWRLNYGNDKTLGDNFISEKVNVELDIKAKRQ